MIFFLKKLVDSLIGYLMRWLNDFLKKQFLFLFLPLAKQVVRSFCFSSNICFDRLPIFGFVCSLWKEWYDAEKDFFHFYSATERIWWHRFFLILTFDYISFWTIRFNWYISWIQLSTIYWNIKDEFIWNENDMIFSRLPLMVSLR